MYGPDYGTAAANVFRLGSLAGGIETQLLERAIGVHTGRHAVAVSSGTAAIHLALIQLNVKQDTRVAVPVVGFPAAALLLARMGATIVPVDVNPLTGLIDANNVPECDLIVAIDLDGNLPDYNALRQYNVPILEDACPAWGSRRSQTPAGGFGDLATFSFHESKKTPAGEGGAVISPDPDIADRLRRLSRFGETEGRIFREPGFNYKMPELSAAMANVSILGFGHERVSNAIDFDTILRALLDPVTGIDPPPKQPTDAIAWHKYRLIGNNLPELLDKAGIPYFGPDQDVPPLHHHPAFGITRTDFPGADEWWAATTAIGDRQHTPFYGGVQLASKWGNQLRSIT